MQSFKTDAEKNGATIVLVTAVNELNKKGITANHKEIADVLDTIPNNFSPSSIHFWRQSLDKLLNESMIAKTEFQREFGCPMIIYKLLRPIEEIEAYFNEYKWDKRQRKTREKAILCENSLDIQTLLKRLSLKQCELAEKSGIDNSTLSKIKHGHIQMSEDIKTKLLAVLKEDQRLAPELNKLDTAWKRTKEIETKKFDSAKSIVIQIKDVKITIEL